MYKIKIQTEFLHGAIWTYDMEGNIVNELEIIENDEKVNKLNIEIEEIFSSYYEFDSHDLPCWFNKEQEKADKEKMLFLITSLISRLNEINDGSYVIEDLETQRLKNL